MRHLVGDSVRCVAWNITGTGNPAVCYTLIHVPSRSHQQVSIRAYPQGCGNHHERFRELCLNKCRASDSSIKVHYFDIGSISHCFLFYFVYPIVYHYIFLFHKDMWADPCLYLQVGFREAEWCCLLEHMLQSQASCDGRGSWESNQLTRQHI